MFSKVSIILILYIVFLMIYSALPKKKKVTLKRDYGTTRAKDLTDEDLKFNLDSEQNLQWEPEEKGVNYFKIMLFIFAIVVLVATYYMEKYTFSNLSADGATPSIEDGLP